MASYLANANGAVQQSMYAGASASPPPPPDLEPYSFKTAVGSHQRNSMMQASVRGVLSRHEGPLQHTPRGVAAA